MYKFKMLLLFIFQTTSLLVLLVDIGSPLLSWYFLYIYLMLCRFRVMVFNATFNNIWVISWRSVLLVAETGVPGENQRPAASQWQASSDYNLIMLLQEINVGGNRKGNKKWTIQKHWAHKTQDEDKQNTI